MWRRANPGPRCCCHRSGSSPRARGRIIYTDSVSLLAKTLSECVCIPRTPTHTHTHHVQALRLSVLQSDPPIAAFGPVSKPHHLRSTRVSVRTLGVFLGVDVCKLESSAQVFTACFWRRCTQHRQCTHSPNKQTATSFVRTVSTASK